LVSSKRAKKAVGYNSLLVARAFTVIQAEER